MTYSQEKPLFFTQYLQSIYQKITISNDCIWFFNTSTFPKNKKRYHYQKKSRTRSRTFILLFS